MNVLNSLLFEPYQIALLKNFNKISAGTKGPLDNFILLIETVLSMNIQYGKALNLHEPEVTFIHAIIIPTPDKVLDLSKVKLATCENNRHLFPAPEPHKQQIKESQIAAIPNIQIHHKLIFSAKPRA